MYNSENLRVRLVSRLLTAVIHKKYSGCCYKFERPYIHARYVVSCYQNYPTWIIYYSLEHISHYTSFSLLLFFEDILDFV